MAMDGRMQDAEIWLAALDGFEAPSEGPFSAFELERADALATPLLRRRFLARRWMAREILAGATGMEPSELILETTSVLGHAAAQPVRRLNTASGELWWSASNSGDVGAVAIAGRRIGIDIERSNRESRRWQRIARRFCTEAEQRAVAKSPAFFIEYWTMKEAFLKALGLGLPGGLRSLDCAGLSQPVDGWGTSTAHPGWRFRHLRPEPGFVVAVAVEGEPRRLEIRRWAPAAAPAAQACS